MHLVFLLWHVLVKARSPTDISGAQQVWDLEIRVGGFVFWRIVHFNCVMRSWRKLCLLRGKSSLNPAPVREDHITQTLQCKQHCYNPLCNWIWCLHPRVSEAALPSVILLPEVEHGGFVHSFFFYFRPIHPRRVTWKHNRAASRSSMYYLTCCANCIYVYFSFFSCHWTFLALLSSWTACGKPKGFWCGFHQGQEQWRTLNSFKNDYK